MPLLERESALAALRAPTLSPAPGRAVPLVFVAGEAGAGKTSLVRALLAGLSPDEWVVGSCVRLGAARPLGPVLDWLAARDEVVASLSPDHAMQAAERVLRSVRVAVIEDAHWADDASLEILGRLARKATPGLATVVVTYRDNELRPTHPLTLLLGDLASQSPMRITVGPLSLAAVSALAEGSELDPHELYSRTAGNAFFISECLASGSLEVSPNVRDAVLARMSQLPADVRAAVDAVAVVPGRCELWLAEALGVNLKDIDLAVERGLLVQPEAGSVAIRHELARLTVLEALPPGRLRELHQQAGRALERPPHGEPDHARIVHHAVAAGDGRRVQRHARAAAEAAIAAGARSQAVAQLERAIEFAPADADYAGMWAALAEQRALLGLDAESIEAYERAIAYARAAGDDARAGQLLARLSGPLSMAGHLRAARSAAQEAVALLEVQPDSAGLALASAQVCTQLMLARELQEAQVWGARARELARTQGDVATEAYACIQGGVATWMAGDHTGLAMLQHGIDIAREHGLVELVAHGLSQIGSGGGEIRAYEEAVPALQAAVAWAEEHELGSRGRYAEAWLGRCQFELGHWDAAAGTLDRVLRSPRTEVITRVTALTALGRLRARRGDPQSMALLDEALTLARRTGHLQRLWPAAAAHAEAAALRGDLAPEVETLLAVHEMAQGLDSAWALDELAYWLGQADVVVESTTQTPFGLQLAGRHAEAADWWERLGCEYEAAQALEAVDELAALARYERLGARSAASRLIERRRAADLPVPRGPNAATRGNPAGLTGRELQVLSLVAAGQTNAAIATSLHISPKTAGHHVSHLLDKLQARSRAEAVTRALALGIDLNSVAPQR